VKLTWCVDFQAQDFEFVQSLFGKIANIEVPKNPNPADAAALLPTFDMVSGLPCCLIIASWICKPVHELGFEGFNLNPVAFCSFFRSCQSPDHVPFPSLSRRKVSFD
jgi:hypothetical protein